jgi:hypothetical protein
MGIQNFEGLQGNIGIGNSPNISKGMAINDLGAKLNLVITPQADDYWHHSNLRICNISTVWNYLRNERLLNE